MRIRRAASRWVRDVDGLLRQYLGHRDFTPLYDELNARDAVVLVHPWHPAYAPSEVGHSPAERFPYPYIEWPFDTARAIANLIRTRVARDYPRIRWIFTHTRDDLLDRVSPFDDARVLAAAE